MKSFSSAFKNNDKIPAKFTCDGENINPEIFIEDVPAEAKSLALVVDDPDSPTGNWNHWIIWNIDSKTRVIGENSAPDGSTSGLNDFEKMGYGGPCPFKGEHRYFFKVFALRKILDLPEGSKKVDLEKAMNGCVLDKCEFMGRYLRV